MAAVAATAAAKIAIDERRKLLFLIFNLSLTPYDALQIAQFDDV